MKHLNELSPQDKIKLAAELDGCEPINRMTGFKDLSRTEPNFAILYKPYSTSYDAIIPLIQKQTGEVKIEMQMIMLNWNTGNFDITPSQLLDALLVATGKATIE